VDFRVLGPLEVREMNGESRALGGQKQRALLAILLLHANEVVSSDRLIDELWGEAPPETAAKALQVHVSQLRKLLEPERGAGDPGRVLITESPGVPPWAPGPGSPTPASTSGGCSHEPPTRRRGTALPRSSATRSPTTGHSA
jgi:hypothetical protein